MISNTNILSQKPCGRQLNTKVCGNKKAIFRILSSTKISREWLKYSHGCSTKWIHTSTRIFPDHWFLRNSNSTFNSCSQHTRASIRWLGRHFFSTFVRTRTRSLVPKPKTTVIPVVVATCTQPGKALHIKLLTNGYAQK